MERCSGGVAMGWRQMMGSVLLKQASMAVGIAEEC